LAEVLADLHRFDLPDGEVDDDAVGAKTFGLNTGFETARGDSHFERFFRRQFTLEILDQDLVLGDDQALGHRFVFQVPQGHPMFLKKLNQVIARDPAILRSRDAITFQTSRVKPFANGSRGYYTDLGDLSSCEALHF